MKRRTSFVAVLVALAVALLPLARNGAADTSAEPAAAPTPMPMPTAQWPSPCSPGVTCTTPHWFYLVNGATESDSSPLTSLVLTVTTPPQASQHNGPPPGQPAVVVGISGSGLTLQPMNASTTSLDNQMWYAVEAASGTVNPSYIISSLPADWLPFTGITSGYSVNNQLALGYIDSSSGNNAVISSASSNNQTFDGIGHADTSNGTTTFGTITLTGTTNPFKVGQTIGINGTGGGDANGIWTVQQVSGQNVTYTIPYQSGASTYSDEPGGNVVSMAAVYLNQQNATGAYLNSTYTNLFQQWNYDSTDRTICNQRLFCLNSIDATPSAGSRVTASAKPSPVTANYQWYFYPDRTLSGVIKQTTAPFPALSNANQKKAQAYIAKKLGLSGLSPCTFGTNTYYGLRCEYSNLAAPLSSYETLLARMHNPPGVTPGNWKKVKTQLLLELTDAIAVQNLFAQVQSVFEMSFLESGFLLDQDLADLAMDLTNQTAQKKFSWETMLEGILYTGLNALGAFMGDPAMGTETKVFLKYALRLRPM